MSLGRKAVRKWANPYLRVPPRENPSSLHQGLGVGVGSFCQVSQCSHTRCMSILVNLEEMAVYNGCLQKGALKIFSPGRKNRGWIRFKFTPRA